MKTNNISTLAIFLTLTLIIYSCSYNSMDEGEQVDCNTSDLTIQITDIVDTECSIDNGQITVGATGGKGPYSFTLNNGPAQTSSAFSGLSAANYEVKVIDKNGCESATEVVINNKEGVNASLAVTDTECGGSGGAISINATNGIEPYMYQLNNGNLQSASSFTGLGPGEYEVKVVDAGGCSVILVDRILSGVSFSASISSIISQNCAISGCHAGPQPPDFREFSNIQTNASRIKTLTQNRSMPRTGSLTQEEIDLIACWVDDGALDN